MLDPESLHGGMQCPRCGAELQLQDLFGLSAAFAEEEEPELSLDDAMPGMAAGGPGPGQRAAAGRGPTPGPAKPRQLAGPAAPTTGRPAPRGAPQANALVPKGGGGAEVPRVAPKAAPTAADLIAEFKKKR